MRTGFETMWPFGRGNLPSDTAIEWTHQATSWFLRNTDGWEGLRASPLVLPTEEFFPIDPSLRGHDLAVSLFESVRSHAGMAEWPCHLTPQDHAPTTRELMPNIAFGSAARTTATLGTFSPRLPE
jgi:hypothetical protein